MNHKTAFRQGMTDGIPIALGYMAVSFTFGIMAKNAGLTAFQAVLLSLTNLTSAGQFAGLGIITASASYIEMAFTQLIINLRYCLMSCALSQKLDQRTPFFHRFSSPMEIRTKFSAYAVVKKENFIPFTAMASSLSHLPDGPLAHFSGSSPAASCRAGY